MLEGLCVLSLMWFALSAIAAAQSAVTPAAAAAAGLPRPSPAAAPAASVPAPAPAHADFPRLRPPAPAPSENDAPGAAAECAPGCRTGYMCLQGVCISACNPPCAAGEQCTAAGECTIPQSVPRPPAEDPEGTREHDGFMLRLTIGLGGSYLNEEGFIDHQDYSVDYYGFSLASAFDIGGAPIENLVLHARVAALDLRKPNVTEDSDDLDFGKPSVNAGLFAPAITYYLMPTNVYLTGAIGLTVVSFFDDNINEGSSTDLGVGVNLDVGKEWWVGNDWGLGVTGRVWYSHNTDGDEETEPFAAVDNLVSFTILLSATYQ